MAYVNGALGDDDQRQGGGNQRQTWKPDDDAKLLVTMAQQERRRFVGGSDFDGEELHGHGGISERVSPEENGVEHRVGGDVRITERLGRFGG